MKIVPLSIFLLSSAQGWAVRCFDRFDKALPSDEQALTQDRAINFKHCDMPRTICVTIALELRWQRCWQVISILFIA